MCIITTDRPAYVAYGRNAARQRSVPFIGQSLCNLPLQHAAPYSCRSVIAVDMYVVDATHIYGKSVGCETPRPAVMSARSHDERDIIRYCEGHDLGNVFSVSRTCNAKRYRAYVSVPCGSQSELIGRFWTDIADVRFLLDKPAQLLGWPHILKLDMCRAIC